MGMIKITGLVADSTIDGPGIRYAIFTENSNKRNSKFSSGVMEVSIDKLVKQIVSSPEISGITLTGGEPFDQIDALLELVYKVKSFGLNVMAFTKYSFEELLSRKESNPNLDRLLHNIDILVEGPYDEKCKDVSYHFIGSTNQRIIDLPKSLEHKSLLLLN